MLDRDNRRILGLAVGWFWGLTVAVMAATVIIFLVWSGVTNSIIAPQQRQNLNNDPDYQRGVAAQFTSAYHDFQAAQTAIPADDAALKQFTVTYGDSSKWNDQEQNHYNQLLVVWQGDYQAEARDAATYNGLADNPDSKKWMPAGYPAQLTADPMPAAP